MRITEKSCCKANPKVIYCIEITGVDKIRYTFAKSKRDSGYLPLTAILHFQRRNKKFISVNEDQILGSLKLWS